MKDYLLIIPAYNEEKAIGGVLSSIIAGGYLQLVDVLVVNDASSDDTADVVKSFEQVNLVTNIFYLGYGSSLQTGYRYALQHNYKYILQMDGDGQHDTCNIQILIDALNSPDENGVYPDIVIGSRFLPGSKSFEISGLKKLSICFFRMLIKATTKTRILDPTSGLQGLNRKAFSYYSVFRNFDNDYPDANMIIQMLMMGYKISEVPSIMHKRVTGTSMHSGLIKPLLYMLMMPLNIFAVYMRQIKSKKEKNKQKVSSDNNKKEQQKVGV